MSPSSHLKTETDSVSETLFVVIRIPDDGQSPQTQLLILSISSRPFIHSWFDQSHVWWRYTYYDDDDYDDDDKT
jgi:hypothetical protein